jgi:putative acetyltransferase
MLIQLERPDQAEIVRLIDELDAYQKPLYPAHSHHGIDMQALLQPHVLFAVARTHAGLAVGCGAVVLEAEYGELKRMYVSPAVRGRGVGQQLLQFLEAQAQSQGIQRFMLETGYLQPQALSLYERCGYVRCGPFGAYTEDPNSVFMCKRV